MTEVDKPDMAILINGKGRRIATLGECGRTHVADARILSLGGTNKREVRMTEEEILTTTQRRKVTIVEDVAVRQEEALSVVYE